jgi:hypothetical protein
MSTKERLTVTVDPQWIEAGAAAVDAGVAPSLSAWVNLALAERAAKERQWQALGQAIAAYEADFGVISPDELARQRRADRDLAADRRRRAPRATARRKRRRGAA